MKLTLIALLCLTAVFATRILQHECIHDDIADTIKYDILESNLNEEDTKRRLQNTAARNITITYDMSYFNNLNMADPALKVALQYFNDLLTIFPKPTGDMKWNQGNKCGLVTVPDADKTTDQDSDLHLYISYTNDPIKIILLILAILIVTHEITHALGFSGSDVKNSVNSAKQPHNNPTSIQKRRECYCPLNSQCLRTTLDNIMVAKISQFCWISLGNNYYQQQILECCYFSYSNLLLIINFYIIFIHFIVGSIRKFTTSLLRDTGFYASVNTALEEPTFYGKDAGCFFVTGACDTTKREFCSTETQKCAYYYYAVSTCNPTKFSDVGCNNQRAYKNNKCYEANGNSQNNPTYIEKLGAGFGQSSRCFISSLLDPTLSINEQVICYNYTCNAANQVFIQVENNTITCSQNNQVVTIPNWNGSLKCPEKLDQFCNYKKVCPNFCSSNSYCNNGA
ncbi:hypothetical protein ABPG72_020515 [Tetrahymena utriculariae]